MDGGSGIGLRRVHKRGEAGKGQLRLVADNRIGVGRRHGPGSHTQRAIALLTQRLEASQKSLALGIVEWVTFAARGCIVDALRDDVLGRTLHHEQPRRTVVDEHGDAAALEIEGNLVDLLPGRDIELLMREDRLVERALDAALEGAV